MNYQQAVNETWRHSHPGIAKTDQVELVRYATLAASSHNTQPWMFTIAPTCIKILPDFARRCTAVDPDDHHLYASLGCAAENLLLAARAVGLQGSLTYNADESCVQINLEPALPARSSLFEVIPQRQCSRAKYDGKPLAAEQLRLLEQAARGDGVSLRLLTTDKEKEQIAEYVAAGNTAQFSDTAWAQELQSWVRFNARDAIRTGDGLYGPVMGNPDVPAWVGKLFMRMAFSAKRQNDKDFTNIRSAGAVAVIVSEHDNPTHWVEAGRSYQRLALQATALELQTAFINQPVEVAALRGQFAAHLGIRNGRPDLIVRLGRGPAMPRTLRRPVAQVIVQS